MRVFRPDFEEIVRLRDVATARARTSSATLLAKRLRAGDSLSDVELATLFLSERVSEDELLAIARERRGAATFEIETFAPLYFTNECHGECRMCGMRAGNDRLARETAPDDVIDAQLDVLHRRGMRGVAVLSGEYRAGVKRDAMLARAARITREAIDRGFEHVLVNVGSLEADEYPRFLDGLRRRDDGRLAPHVTMCTFQETYDPRIYARFMGTTEGNPRCDYHRRLGNFDRAAAAGFRSVNPGILVGLNPDLAYELVCLCAHVRHLEQLGMQVYISLPRLRKASGAEHARGASDDTLTRLVALLAAAFVDAKVVISTREKPEVQHRLLEAIGVLTPGSPGVAPYGEADAVFDLDASQFDVADKRPFEEILVDVRRAGFEIDGFVPADAARDDRASMRES